MNLRVILVFQLPPPHALGLGPDVASADVRCREDAPRESQTLFSHPDAEARFGASVFWLREGMVPVNL
jgi:hypothetical protein